MGRGFPKWERMNGFDVASSTKAKCIYIAGETRKLGSAIR